MGRRSKLDAAAAATAPYEIDLSWGNTASDWQPSSHCEVRYWLGGYTYTAASAILAMDRGEEVDMIWGRIRRKGLTG